MYLNKLNDSIFTSLLIVNTNPNFIDTIYYIDELGRHFNSIGECLELSKSKVTRYLLSNIGKDFLMINATNEKFKPISDPLILSWNFEKRIFEWERTP